MAFLITDQEFESITPLYEGVEGGKKSLFIEGIYLQGESKNRNGRIYPINLLDREGNRYVRDYVNTKRALGELNHPPTPAVNPERASHLITEMIKVGNNWKGKAKILDTPMGNIVRGIIEGGGQIGVSSRGLGTLKESTNGKIVQDDFYLSTIDIVSDPSAQVAWVNGIYEGQEWACPNEQQQGFIMRDIDAAVRAGNMDEKFLLDKFNSFIHSLK